MFSVFFFNLVGSYCDTNMKKAKYVAADQVLCKLKEMYGEEALLTKSEKNLKKQTIPNRIDKRENTMIPMKEEIRLLGKKTSPSDIDLVDFRTHMNGLIHNIENNVNHTNLQRNFELFCNKYERFIIVSPNMFEINELCIKIRESFGRPHFIGSYLYDCLNVKNYTIDIMLTHTLPHDEIIHIMSNAYDEIYIINNKDTELDIQINFKDRQFSFMIYLRKIEDVKDFIEYSTLHDDLLCKKITKENYKYNLPILRRLIRSWRRKTDLLELLPEYLDWVVINNISNSVSESVKLL